MDFRNLLTCRGKPVTGVGHGGKAGCESPDQLFAGVGLGMAKAAERL